MKPAAFEYFRPEGVEQAVALLERHGPDAKVLAGGQSLVPLMNFRLAQPGCLVDIGRIQSLTGIGEENGSIVIGSMVRQSTIEDSATLAADAPLLVEATRLIGHRTVRNRGTIGGSLAHADPAAEYPAALLALDGEVRVVGPAGRRSIAAEDLFITVCMTSIAPDELLVDVRIPKMAPGTGWAFAELSRRHGDYAIVGAAIVVSLESNGLCNDVRIALAGVGQTPIRCHDAESMLRWSVPNAELIREVCERCREAARPQGDLHATADYKRAMIGVFVERALRTALRRAGRDENGA